MRYAKPLDLTNQRFTRLTAIRYIGSKQNCALWSCVCDCGNTVEATSRNLRTGHVRSCGCLRRDNLVSRMTRHGKGDTPTWRSWDHMVQRCTNPRNTSFAEYGGRGITISERWRTSFEDFLADMGERPSLGQSIDRIDNTRGYEPGNCRWATRREQQNNTRSNRRVEFDGATRTLAEWEREMGLSRGTISARLRAGWTVAQAIETPPGCRRAA